MESIIEIFIDENTKIYVEATKDNIPITGQFKKIKNSAGVITKAGEYFEGAINQIKVFANKIAESVIDLPSSPNEVELEFSVKFSAEAGVVITTLGSEASVTIKLKWSDSK